MRLRQYLLLVLLVVSCLSIASIATPPVEPLQGPPGTLVNNQYITGQTVNGVARSLLGLNRDGLVSIDPNAVGSTMAGSLNVTGVATIPNLTITTITGTIAASNLPANLKTGYIPLDLFTARIISSDAIQNTTEAGVPDGNTSPLIARVNAATDKMVRVAWASSNSAELQFAPFVLPGDVDLTATINVKFLAAMAGATDTPTVTVFWFAGIGDTTQGGATGAVTGTVIAAYTRAIAASAVNTAAKPVSISITPGAHTTDILYMYSAWVEYTRKS